MAKFRITDNQTGKSVVVSGDTPPSPSDAESIFSAAGLRGEQQPQSQPQSPLQQAGNGVMGVLNFLAPQAVKTAQNLGSGIANTGGEIYDIYKGATGSPQEKQAAGQDFIKRQGVIEGNKQALNPGQIAKTGLELGSYMASPGKGVAQGLAAGGLSGLLYGASRDNATPQSVALSGVTGAGTGAVLNGVGGLVSGALKNTGEGIQNQGEQLVLRGLRPTKTQLTSFRNKTGVDLADYLTQKGITGDFKNEAANLTKNLQDNYDQIVLNSNKTVSPDQFDELTKPVVDEFKKSKIPEVKAKADQIMEYFSNIKNAYENRNIPLADIVQYRRELDQLIPPTAFDVNPTTTKYYRAARDAMKNVIDETTKDTTINGQSTKELGKELNRAYTFKKIADTQGDLSRGNKLVRLLGGVMTGAGATVGGIPGAIAAYVGTEAASHPKVVGLGSQTLQKTGQAIQNAGNGTLNPVLVDLLKRIIRSGSEKAVNQ